VYGCWENDDAKNDMFNHPMTPLFESDTDSIQKALSQCLEEEYTIVSGSDVYCRSAKAEVPPPKLADMCKEKQFFEANGDAACVPCPGTVSPSGVAGCCQCAGSSTFDIVYKPGATATLS